MARSELKKRLDALEGAVCPPQPRIWHRIVRHEGGSEEEAVAAYEAVNGPMGPDDGQIMRIIVQAPGASPLLASEGLK